MTARPSSWHTRLVQAIDAAVRRELERQFTSVRVRIRLRDCGSGLWSARIVGVARCLDRVA